MEVSTDQASAFMEAWQAQTLQKEEKEKEKRLWCLERPLSADAFRFRSYVYLPFAASGCEEESAPR